MNRERDQIALRRLLDLCAEIEEVDEQAALETTSIARRRSRSRRKVLLKNLRTLITAPKGRGLPEWLQKARQRHRLDVNDVLVLVFVLHKRIVSNDPHVSGRDLLRLLGETSVELLRLAPILELRGRLRESGVIEPRGSGQDPVLDDGFRLSERIFFQAYRVFHGRRQASRRKKPTAYTTAVDHLMDFKVLSDLLRRRAAALFPLSLWAEFHPDVREKPSELSAAIQAMSERIAAREAATPTHLSLPLRDFAHEFSLRHDDVAIIVTLLFLELASVQALIPAAELLRLIAAAPEDVIRRRYLLVDAGPLLASGALHLESEIAGKPLLALTCLQEWVVDRLLATGIPEARIGEDERARFHAFLQNLDGSEDFFRKL